MAGVRCCALLVLQHVGDMYIHIPGLVCNLSSSNSFLGNRADVALRLTSNYIVFGFGTINRGTVHLDF